VTTIIVLNEEAYGAEELETDFLIYNHTCESYEGYGMALAQKNGKWYVHDMGHCSCYGPFDEFCFDKPYSTLEETIKTLHAEDWAGYAGKTIEQMKNMSELFDREKE